MSDELTKQYRAATGIATLVPSDARPCVAALRTGRCPGGRRSHWCLYGDGLDHLRTWRWPEAGCLVITSEPYDEISPEQRKEIHRYGVMITERGPAPYGHGTRLYVLLDPSIPPPKRMEHYLGGTREGVSA